VAQVVVLAAAPVLTRLFGPEAFGGAALFAAVVGIIGVVACLRYDLSIVIPASDDEGAALFWASLAISAVTSTLVLVVFLLLPTVVVDRLGASEIPAFPLLVAVGCFLTGVFSTLNYWNSRTRKFGRLASARVVNTSVTAAVQIGAGVAASAGAGSLVGGSLAGSGVATGFLAARVAGEDRRVLARNLRVSSIVAGLRRHRHFPMYNTWAALMNTLSWQLPALVLGAYFSASVVGYYALGFRVLGLPMSLVGIAIGQVFYQRAAVARESGGLATLVRGVFSVLVDVGLVPFVVLAIAGRAVFVVAFGAAWGEAGVYVQILAIWSLVWFISSPMSTLYAVLDRQGAGLWLSAGILVSRFASLMVGGWLGQPRLSLFLFAASGVLVYGYLNQFVMTHSGVPWGDAWRILARASLRGLAPCGTVAVVVLAGAGSFWVFIVAMVVISANTVWAWLRWRRVMMQGVSSEIG